MIRSELAVSLLSKKDMGDRCKFTALVIDSGAQCRQMAGVGCYDRPAVVWIISMY